jgi:hypothetical protein
MSTGSEHSFANPENALTGECPPQKPAQCGSAIPLSIDTAAELWAHSAYDFLHDADTGNRFIMTARNPVLEHCAYLKLVALIHASCKGNA